VAALRLRLQLRLTKPGQHFQHAPVHVTARTIEALHSLFCMMALQQDVYTLHTITKQIGQLSSCAKAHILLCRATMMLLCCSC
jgi:hypothetical protein